MEQSRRNQWQLVANRAHQERLKPPQTVAVGCDQLPIGAHGKEGVDGSSPSEGSAKAPEIGAFSFQADLLHVERALGMKPFMELSPVFFPKNGGHLRAASLVDDVDRLARGEGVDLVEDIRELQLPLLVGDVADVWRAQDVVHVQ
jgi:hypothetical protein